MKTTKNGPVIQTLGDALGSLHYLGQCFDCGEQFMPVRERVIFEGHIRRCVPCGTRAHAELAAVDAVAEQERAMREDTHA